MLVEGYGCDFIKDRGLFAKWWQQTWVDWYAVGLTPGAGVSGPSDQDRTAGAAVDQVVDLVHGSMVDRSKGYAAI
jgi:hypothetical protein